MDWIHATADQAVQTFLGEGGRWGLSIRHHSTAAADEAYAIAGNLLASRSAGEKLLLAHADRMAEVPVNDDASAPVVLGGHTTASGEWQWNGCAIVTGETWWVPHICSKQQLQSHLATHPAGLLCVTTASPKAIRTLGGFLEANRAVLSEQVAGLPKDVWVSPSASVHPTATLTGPVTIGARSEIGAGARIGPYVSVSANCVVEGGTTLVDAVVLPGTYLAEGFHLVSAVADRDQVLVQREDGASVAVTGAAVGSLTDHLPARLIASLVQWFARIAWRVTGLRGVGKWLRHSVTERLKGERTSPTSGALPAAPATD